MSVLNGNPARVTACASTELAIGSLSTSTPLQSKMTKGRLDDPAVENEEHRTIRGGDVLPEPGGEGVALLDSLTHVLLVEPASELQNKFAMSMRMPVVECTCTSTMGLSARRST